jgi:hypothetical protein
VASQKGLVRCTVSKAERLRKLWLLLFVVFEVSVFLVPSVEAPTLRTPEAITTYVGRLKRSLVKVHSRKDGLVGCGAVDHHSSHEVSPFKMRLRGRTQYITTPELQAQVKLEHARVWELAFRGGAMALWGCARGLWSVAGALWGVTTVLRGCTTQL